MFRACPKKEHNNNFYPFTCVGQLLCFVSRWKNIFSSNIHSHKTIIVKGWSKNHKWNGKMIFFCLPFFCVGFICVIVCIFVSWLNFFSYFSKDGNTRKKRKNICFLIWMLLLLLFWYVYAHIGFEMESPLGIILNGCSIFVMCSMRRKIYFARTFLFYCYGYLDSFIDLWGYAICLF